MFTVAQALLFRDPAGVAAPGRLVDIGSSRNGYGFSTISYLVSANYFAALGAVPALGRLFRAASVDVNAGSAGESEPFIVLSDRFWRRRFNADPTIVGRTLTVNGQAYVVSGVAADGFHGTGVFAPDVWVPLTVATERAVLANRKAVWLNAGGRLKPGVSVAQAARRARRHRSPPGARARAFTKLECGTPRGCSIAAAGRWWTDDRLHRAARCHCRRRADDRVREPGRRGARAGGGAAAGECRAARDRCGGAAGSCANCWWKRWCCLPWAPRPALSLPARRRRCCSPRSRRSRCRSTSGLRSTRGRSRSPPALRSSRRSSRVLRQRCMRQGPTSSRR